jgi:hypothetical protein
MAFGLFCVFPNGLDGAHDKDHQNGGKRHYAKDGPSKETHLCRPSPLPSPIT